MTAGSTDSDELARLRAEVAAWRARAGALPVREDGEFSSVSGREVEPVYTPLDFPGNGDSRIELPGEYPYTRGIHPTMYRGRLWTMRQFAGFGTAEDTNERYKFLLERGQTGLSVAFDFPTLMGYDSDHPRSEGEVGKCGVAVSSLADMETLFDGIPLDRVSTSMTINGPAAMLFCFYVAAAERQGVPIDQLQGTIQNDILKEYMAQHAWIFPAEPALKVIVDLFEWASRAYAQVEHHLDLGVPHPRGRRDCRSGARLHARQWFLLCGAWRGPRARGRPVRASALVLLGRPQRLLRGDRKVTRGSPDLGPAHARAIRGPR